MARKSRPHQSAKQNCNAPETIEVILSAGEVIEEQGYQSATTDRIAARTGEVLLGSYIEMIVDFLLLGSQTD